MACADVQSANIVGYIDKGLNKNFTACGSSFITIGVEGMKLTTIKPKGIPAMSNGQIQIQVLDNLGNATKTYKYYQGSKVKAFATDGWYDNTTLITSENDVTFMPGQGLWVKGTIDNTGITTAGEVSFDDVQKQLNVNFVMLCNPFPQQIKLSKNIKAGGLAATSNGQVQIQELDNLGNATKTYKYYQGSKVKAFATDGWYLNTTLITAENDVTFEPGQGLWVKGSIASATLTFTLNEEN